MCVSCGNNGCGGCQPIIPTGLSGVDGINAFNYTTATFVQPAIGDTVVVSVQSVIPFSNIWMGIGQYLFISGTGYYKVQNLIGVNQVTLINLGYTDANFTPLAPTSNVPSGTKISPAGIKGAGGATGGNGANGASRIYYTKEFLSGSGSPKTFFTVVTEAASQPLLEGESLLLTFNVKTNNSAKLIDRLIGISFGGQECVAGIGNKMYISQNSFFNSQFKVEVIRTAVSGEAQVRFSADVYDGAGYGTYSEVNTITGINWTVDKNFVVSGTQNANNTFTFQAITIDKFIML